MLNEEKENREKMQTKIFNIIGLVFLFCFLVIVEVVFLLNKFRSKDVLMIIVASLAIIITTDYFITKIILFRKKMSSLNEYISNKNKKP